MTTVRAVAAAILLLAVPMAEMAPTGVGYPPGDPTSQGGGGVTTFKVQCPASHRLPDDPIVFPGKPGASHLHQFIGNRTTDANSTADSLLAGGTTCDDQADTSAYWVPALYQ